MTPISNQHICNIYPARTSVAGKDVYHDPTCSGLSGEPTLCDTIGSVHVDREHLIRFAHAPPSAHLLPRLLRAPGYRCAPTLH